MTTSDEVSTAENQISGNTSERSENKKHVLIWILIACAIFFGVVARFANLETKTLWRDEVATQFYIAANPSQVPVLRFLSRDEVLHSVALDNSTSVIDVVKQLANHSAEQAPFFYVVERSWCDVFGDSRVWLRLPCVIFGTLAIGAAYLLGAELFGSTLAGGFTAVLVALSPFHIASSLEARPYSLWELLICLSCWMMLRALRQPSVGRWVLFGTVLVACEYTQSLSLEIVAALGVWAVLQKPVSRALLVTLCIAAAAFYPWYSRIAPHGTKTNWLVQSNLTWLDCLQQVYNVVAHSMIELQLPGSVVSDLMPALIWSVLFIAICVLVFKVPRRAWTLPVALLAVPCVALIVYAMHNHLSITKVDRYFIPALIGTALLFSGALAASTEIANRRLRTAVCAVLAIVCVLTAASAVRFCTNPKWHDRNIGIVQVVAEINKDEKPVIVAKMNPLDVVGLAQSLRPESSIYFLGLRDSTEPVPDVPVDYWLVTQSSHAIQGQFIKHNSHSM